MSGTAPTLVSELGLGRRAPTVAPSLLGCVLSRDAEEGASRARIVETEAYTERDPASHSFNGPTSRSEVMFGPPGFWYIYKCYGLHWMLNVVCGPEGCGEAVLIRAAEPLRGCESMARRRETTGRELTNGPAKLTQALDVDDRFNRSPIRPDADLSLEAGPRSSPVYESPRVGIQRATDRRWRFYLDNEYVSEAPENANSRRRN